MNLPAQYVNITFNWYVEDMEDFDDKEAIQNLTQLKYEHFYGSEEWIWDVLYIILGWIKFESTLSLFFH